MRGIVYKYTSPSGKVYIGQTCRDRGRRNEFQALARPYSSGHFIDSARQKYGPDNFTYEVLFEINGDDGNEINKVLNYWESYYISYYKSNDKRYGYNMNDGGAGNTGITLSDEARAKIGQKTRQRLKVTGGPMKGKKHSSESIIKMKLNTQKKYGKDNPNYGWKPPQELIDRLSAIAKERTGDKNHFYGKTHTEETRQLLREKFSQPVVQVDAQTFKDIKTYPSAIEAAKAVIGNTRGSSEIGKVCNKYKRPNGIQSVTAYGYRWRWASDEPFIVKARIPAPPSFKGHHLTQQMKDNISKINSKAVCQLDPNTMEVIAIYKSCQAAADALGHSRSNSDIGKMCNGKIAREKVLGYKWKWYNQL